MNITVLGTGYVGLVTGTCLADSGNDVVCVDVDKAKVEKLLSGGVPIYEPGLAELIARNREDGRVDFTTDVRRGVEHGDVIFIAVGTPMSESGEADLRYVFAAAADIGRHMNGYKVVVDKSTVPVGTSDRVKAIIADSTNQEFDIVSNPEFLKEGTAISDFMKPDRVVVGGDSKRALDIMRELYEPFLRTFHPLIVMDIRSAEMTKYAANCFLATKISFINEIANLAERLGADIEMVRRGIGSDSRIGYDFIYAGCGFGGSCFPKDIQALQQIAQGLGYQPRLLQAVEAVNAAQKQRLFEKVSAHYGGNLRGRTFALWGLAFKPNTDDMRDAPSRELLAALWQAGAQVQAFDPEAMDEARRLFGARDDLRLTASKEEALEGADALLIVTEWQDFRVLDEELVKAKLADRVIFDGRNLFEPATLAAAGITYYGIGRGCSVEGAA